MKDFSRLVYSTDRGRVRAEPEAEGPPPPAADAPVLIRRESKGRGGKTVTVITQLPLTGAELSTLAKDLKKLCGVGGTVKPWTIELQGDHRPAVQRLLEGRGFKVKLAGG